MQHNDTPPNFTNVFLIPSPAVMQIGDQASNQTESSTEPKLEYLLFDTNCMSTERAHTLLWLALHQLWVLSWMTVESKRPKPISLNQWLKAVRQSEKDLQNELQGKRNLKFPVFTTETDRLLCANDLFHIAGGMNRWMMLEQRYKFKSTNTKKWELFYLIKPNIASSIHEYLDSSNLMDFRFRPGMPTAMNQEKWNSKKQNWQFVFKGFPHDLAYAHRRFMIRLIRETITNTTTNTNNIEAEHDHDDDHETIKTSQKRKKNNLSKSTISSKRTRAEELPKADKEDLSSPLFLCPLPVVDSTWNPSKILSADSTWKPSKVLSASRLTIPNQSSSSATPPV